MTSPNSDTRAVGPGWDRRWREAGLAAMVGTFTFADVRGAIARSEPTGWHDGMYRFADRLLQTERRAGRIRTTPGNKRKWERVPTPENPS